jgi:hypothetical protein
MITVLNPIKSLSLIILVFALLSMSAVYADADEEKKPTEKRAVGSFQMATVAGDPSSHSSVWVLDTHSGLLWKCASSRGDCRYWGRPSEWGTDIKKSKK